MRWRLLPTAWERLLRDRGGYKTAIQAKAALVTGTVTEAAGAVERLSS